MKKSKASLLPLSLILCLGSWGAIGSMNLDTSTSVELIVAVTVGFLFSVYYIVVKRGDLNIATSGGTTAEKVSPGTQKEDFGFIMTILVGNFKYYTPPRVRKMLSWPLFILLVFIVISAMFGNFLFASHQTDLAMPITYYTFCALALYTPFVSIYFMMLGFYFKWKSQRMGAINT